MDIGKVDADEDLMKSLFLGALETIKDGKI